jgi:hypothetical protein
VLFVGNSAIRESSVPIGTVLSAGSFTRALASSLDSRPRAETLMLASSPLLMFTDAGVTWLSPAHAPTGIAANSAATDMPVTETARRERRTLCERFVRVLKCKRIASWGSQ